MDVGGVRLISPILKYATMAFYPFLLFVPAIVILSAAVASVIANPHNGASSGTHGDATHAKSKRREGRRRVLRFMSISTVGLFAFMSVMVACAETSRWIMFGLVSGVVPVILMLLARLTAVYGKASATPSCARAGANTGLCTSKLLWSKIAAEASREHHAATRAAALIGFVAAFLPFLAGFLYVLSPPYLLAVPVSSLTTCAVTGVFGVIPVMAAIAAIMIGVKSSYWMLSRLFHVYGWFVRRSFSLLLSLTIIALIMAARELLMKVPSYL